VNTWFWRTYDQKEVDYIEEEGGKITAVEFKLTKSGTTQAKNKFLEIYKEASFITVTKENYLDFLLLSKMLVRFS
jgi:hypothetical protein